MIIDMHTHIGNVMEFEMPTENLIESMKKYNISLSITSNCEAAAFDHNQKPLPYTMQKSQEEAFQVAIDFAREHMGKIAIMPWIKPHFEGVTPQLIEQIRDNLDITVGIKLHPVHSLINVNSPQVKPYLELAERFDLPVLVHTGTSPESTCESVYECAVKHPNIKFILGHMGLGSDNSDAIKFIKKQPNLYGDTAWVPVESTVKAIKECGSEKILFGTDNTIDGVDTLAVNPKGERSLYQQYFNELKDMITPEEYANLMYKNSIRLFKLDKILTKNKAVD